MILTSELYKAHMQLHPQLPCSESVCREFLYAYPQIAHFYSLEDAANLFADYVGSQSLYEQGAEAEW